MFEISENESTAYKFTNTGLFQFVTLLVGVTQKDVNSENEGFSDDYILQKNENRKKSLENLNKGFETKGVSSVTRKNNNCMPCYELQFGSADSAHHSGYL